MRPTDALRVLADPYALSILAGTQKQEKTAVELSQRFRIPIAVAYRRVQELVQAGLLEAAGQALMQDARRIWMYRAKLRNATAEFNGVSLRVAFSDYEGKVDEFGGPWTLQEAAGPPMAWEVERLRKGSSLYFPASSSSPKSGTTSEDRTRAEARPPEEGG